MDENLVSKLIRFCVISIKTIGYSLMGFLLAVKKAFKISEPVGRFQFSNNDSLIHLPILHLK